MSWDSEKASGTPLEGGDDSSKLAAFEQHRGLLFSIAYRMLGSVADAEDTLQDAFIRWQRASEVDIRSPKAFLVTIVSRLCINHLQSARVQREAYVGEWLPEPLVTSADDDPARKAEMADSRSLAFLVVLGQAAAPEAARRPGRAAGRAELDSSARGLELDRDRCDPHAREPVARLCTDMGWVTTVASPTNPSAQVSIVGAC
jgi:DNA-directed RNA polymerase specialized sigma24 family protein